MGEIADMIINGDLDCYTGEYIGRGHGFPRTRNKSLPWESKNYTYSKEIAFKGVSKYLKKVLGVTDITLLVNEYIPDPQFSLNQKCLSIQKDFGLFVKWVQLKKRNKPQIIQP